MTIMKTSAFFPPPTSSAFAGALNQPKVYLCILCLIIVTLWNTHSVTAAPAKLDSLDSTFPLDIQPPVFEASASASSPTQFYGNSAGTSTTIDSYGNPIGSLQPIETPDGRKVVSAQGLQFEIPNYASGITELKKPADDLLPPFVDPIVVALPDTSSESFSTNPGPYSSDETTSVDVEHVPLVEVKTQPAATHAAITTLSNGLPAYILELNDPDIGGPVDYQPSAHKRALNVIAWDLLPPLEESEDAAVNSISHSNKDRPANGHNLIAQASQESSHTTQRPQVGLTSPNYTQYRGGVSYTNSITATTTTPRTTTTTTPRTTTTRRATSRTTTTPRTTTTTTRRTTTPRTTTTTTTTAEPDSSEFFRLEAGDSYTLPPWLQDIDDPDLDVAVTFEVPADINEYNHTISLELLPPLEPYTDLNNIHLTPPPDSEETPITTERATATTATTTTTTRRPNLTTIKPHWIRAKPTSPKPTIATFNNQFTSLSPSSSSTYFAQRTTSTTSTTTTSTTTVKPKTSISFHNRPLSSNTPQTDKIGGNSGSDEEGQTYTRNPFLSTFDDGKYKPQSASRRTTTTTTTTPAPEIIEKNPFEATIPPWLKDFDYPDLGPGVPFIYDPNEDENPVDKNILPPSKTATEDTNAKTNPTPNVPFLNSQTPQAFTNKFTSSAIPLTSSSIPSIVTIPIPSTQTNQQDDSTFTQQPFVFVPATPNSAEGLTNADKSNDFSKQTSSTFNKNFAAPFDPAPDATSSSAVTGAAQKNVPLSADRESFPPFNNILTGSSTTPTKTTFSKSEDGKVITNNIFLSGGGVVTPTSSKPIGVSPAVSSQEKNTITTQSSSGSTLTTSASASGFVTASATSSSSFGPSASVDGLKYTGRFGGPPGVLAPQVTGFTASSTTESKAYSKPDFTNFGVTSSAGRGTNNNAKFTGSFGGPPGVLKPYDNIKNR